MNLLNEFFRSADYTLALPMVMLALFGCGILIIDLLVPEEWKVFNAWSAFVGLGFAAVMLTRMGRSEFLVVGGMLVVAALNWVAVRDGAAGAAGEKKP